MQSRTFCTAEIVFNVKQVIVDSENEKYSRNTNIQSPIKMMSMLDYARTHGHLHDQVDILAVEGGEY